MPWKDIEKRREAIRKHYYANRQSYIDKALKRKQEIRAWVTEIKNKSPCTDCKIQYPSYVTDFDHVGRDKKDTVSSLINSGNLAKIKLEIAKCELVCSNCHRIRTYKRKKDKDTV